MAAGRQNHLLYVSDRNSGRHFLTDSGAFSSVFPASSRDRRFPSAGVVFTAANGTNIKKYGSRAMSLDFGFGRFNWTFTLTDVNQPILGADFFTHFGLLIDLRSRALSMPNPSSQ